MRLENYAASVKRAKFLLVALALAFTAVSSTAQVPTPEQLNALKSLPQDQQQELIQSVLGGKSDGTNRKTDPRLDMPETVDSQTDRSRLLQQQNALERERDQTTDGRTLRRARENPELRAFDSVLIDLTPYELTPNLFNTGVPTPPAVGTSTTGTTPGGAGVTNALGAVDRKSVV